LVASLTSSAPRQFLEQIVTEDESLVYHDGPESKARSMGWKRPTSPVAKKFGRQTSAGKNMLTLLENMEGVVYSTPKGETSELL
jgi:hypothetical protein